MDSEKSKFVLSTETAGFIHSYVKEDLKDELSRIKTRFPPEPSGYLHIGHAKAIYISSGLASLYGGTFNLRFDDTNPAKESSEFEKSIMDDVKWLGCDVEDRIFYASDYFEKFYDCAVTLIKKGLAFVCELSADEMREYRGTLKEAGKESPFRNRSVEENLDLFERMKNGEFPDGSLTLRAKIDMASPNMNMRDPVIFRIARLHHHRLGDEWCIYAMYDFAHPLEDAIEGITHSLCSIEFEDHRPFYDWTVNNAFEVGAGAVLPRQIEFAKFYLADTISGKRHIKKLVEDGVVDGWDDPRLITIAGMRRRGYLPSAIINFCEMTGVSKASSRVDFSQLEFCVRDDLKIKSKVVMAILDPVKVVITNYPENQTEMCEIENNQEVPEMGKREMPFSREIYIEKSDFMEEAPPKFFRLAPGKEVRLKGAYFITCTDFIKDENGNITEIHATYDPETKSGSGFEGRKVKGTIHWVSCAHAIKVKAMLYDRLVIDDETSETGFVFNPNSLFEMENCYVEPSVKGAGIDERFQFMRNGYFCVDSKNSTDENMVFNRIVSLKSSYK